MLTLERQECKLTHVNIRSENHGEELATAVDLKLETMFTNDFLAHFAPTLKHSLYYVNPDKGGDLVDQSHAEDAHYAPSLRYPKLGPLKWDEELTGATFTVHTGAVSGKDMELELSNVNEFTLEPIEGGMVRLTFRVQTHPCERDIGRLASFIKQTVEVSVTPPGEPVG